MTTLDVTVVPAGAGSGKTYYVETTLRDWIIAETVRPERVVAVTFTDSAALEMRQRIRQTLLRAGRTEDALALDRAYISTTHSFGMRLLREYAFAVGASPAPRTMTGDEKDFLLRLE